MAGQACISFYDLWLKINFMGIPDLLEKFYGILLKIWFNDIELTSAYSFDCGSDLTMIIKYIYKPIAI